MVTPKNPKRVALVSSSQLEGTPRKVEGLPSKLSKTKVEKELWNSQMNSGKERTGEKNSYMNTRTRRRLDLWNCSLSRAWRLLELVRGRFDKKGRSQQSSSPMP